MSAFWHKAAIRLAHSRKSMVVNLRPLSRAYLHLARRRTCNSEDLTLPRPPDGSHFPAVSAAAEKRVAAVRLEPRHRDAGRHVELLQNLAIPRVDPAQLAFLVFPSAVPELAVHPGHTGHEAVRINGAQNRAGLWIDLVNLALAILPNPQAPFRPGHAGGATFGRRDGRDHAASIRVDLLNAFPGNLV